MELYCTTAKCLRNCILSYFGEDSRDPCGNCSNCLGEFEKLDVSEAAEDVVLCVSASGQRYGAAMIAATLLGANTAKIRSARMDQNPAYGKQRALGQKMIREVIRAMVEQGYLRQTDDKYTVLKLTPQSGQLSDGEGSFWIEYKKEMLKQTADSAKKLSRKPSQTENLSEKGQKLFEELRKLRYELARKRGIPPYMVFSDKTLRDMCIRLPLTEEELLDVNGMGEKKLEQYGGSFLEKIKTVTGGDRETWGTENDEQ